MKHSDPSPNGERLLTRLDELATIGRGENDACCRLALSDDDRRGRDLVVDWMRELDLEISIDPIGNIFGRRPGRNPNLAPVMTGSHIDTVRSGGKYDGNLGVLAGLEAVATLNDSGFDTERPLVVAVFTNEEGARFAPDMLGSLVYVGGLDLDDALAARAIDGAILGEELERIGYAGSAPLGSHRPSAFVELHVEQGPVLDMEGITIGVVENLQGISWQEITITGQSNHAGTTPMRMRHDAGYAAGAITAFVRELSEEMSKNQVATVGSVDLAPNLINVIASRATLTVDLRNTDELLLQRAESRLAAFLDTLEKSEGVCIDTRRLARFEPVTFDAGVAAAIAAQAEGLGYSHRPMTSGAGHDAQMLARICPTAMIFVPSVNGISHNPDEYTSPEDVIAGARVLLSTLIELCKYGNPAHFPHRLR
ncbi:MAG: Zn-dependent hydrolase [Proteobacteria bacterium]|nr:MAG: Zn-dependent hydrolase [Pseudomonadota bacterium]